MVFDLHLTAESTLFPDLESFVRFSRSRKFEDALDLFDAKLKRHLDDAFLVTIEYADLLFEQGDYRTLSEFLGTRIAMQTATGEERPALEEPGADEEIQLLEAMKSLADIFTKGALRSALVQARRCRDFLARKHRDSLRKLPTNVQVNNQLLEPYQAL